MAALGNSGSSSRKRIPLWARLISPGRGGEPPKVVLYLGRFLPPAVIAMLIVYCYRGTSFTEFSGWAPGFIAGAAVVLLHVWKRNNMLSIVGGTILYMVLVQAVF